MATLDQSHNEGQDKFVYTCNNCTSIVESRWHCTVCDDFYLCAKCYTEDGHIHEMQKSGFELGDNSAGADKTQINSQESRKLTIQRNIIAIEHASRCEDINCCLLSQPNCEKVKKIMLHVKRRRCSPINGSCATCKLVITLICYHAKKCQENKCPVLFCSDIQRKLKAKNGTTANSKMLNDNCPKSTTRQLIHGSSSRTSQPSPYTRPATPHMVGSPGSYGNSANINHLTTNSALLYTQNNLQQQHMQKPMPQMQPIQLNQMMGVRNMCNWGYSSVNQNILFQDTQPGIPLGLRPAHSQMMGAKNMPNPADPACGGGSQVMDNPGTLDPGSIKPKNSEQDLKIKQLLKSLKSSKLSNQKEFLQQKKQVLQVLNSDPQLMAAFINQK